MSRNRYGNSVESYGSENGLGGGGYRRAPALEGENYGSYEQGGNSQRYESSSISTVPLPQKLRTSQSRHRFNSENEAEKKISTVLEHIRTDWPTMCQKECVPVQIAIQLLDNSSVGKAHQYRQFQQTYKYLQDSLKSIVHEHHQAFNSSIGAFHKIQTCILSAQKRVRNLKESIDQSKANIATTDSELKKLAIASQNYTDLILKLSEIEELRLVPDQLESQISEKKFIAAVDTLKAAISRIRVPELNELRALSEIKNYLTNQEAALTDILIEELHDHLYLKSPYCQERWQIIAESQRSLCRDKVDKKTSLQPFYEILGSIDLTEASIENDSLNPEADSSCYIQLIVEALSKVGCLELTVNKIKQRLPVELFAIVNETNSEVDQMHPSSLRGSGTSPSGDKTFDIREKSIQSDVIHDLLWTLFAKFESIAENHRILHEVIKAISQREGIKNSLELLSGFRELWHLYQNEIQSLLHNYVTTDADVYQFTSSISGPSRPDLKKENLFRFSDTDTKSVQLTTEYQELDIILRSAVPGLIPNKKQGSDGKKLSLKPERLLRRNASRKEAITSGYDAKPQGVETHKSLVEPSVFNMSLLLPPTLEFLQRLKMIVPLGSEIITSTLTSFLDNFLVNVFLPQLDETLGKLSDRLFEESDAFQQDPQWSSVCRRPIFKGTITFFNLITAFSRMLNKIPHDQALSQLIITQMMRYYEYCYSWYRSLTSKLRYSEGTALKRSAFLAHNQSKICIIAEELWASHESGELSDEKLEEEVSQLILHTNETRLQLDDMLTDRETISSLCMLYSSIKWLAIKIKGLRYITCNDSDSSRTKMKKPITRRWSLSNDTPRDQVDQNHVYLPMTEETAVGFDSIVSSYQMLARTVLLTLHMEIRCQIMYSLTMILSSDATPYLLEQALKDPNPKILALNSDLLYYDDTIVRLLPGKENNFIRRGLSLLVDRFLVVNSSMVGAMNAHGCERMLLDIFVLQQNLKAIEPDVSLNRAATYFNLFNGGPGGVIDFLKQEKEKKDNEGATQLFNLEELKTLIKLCYSESFSNSERGGQHVPLAQSRHDPLTSVATTASDSRHDVSSSYFDKRHSASFNGNAYAESPPILGHSPSSNSPYSPGMRSSSIIQGSNTNDNFGNISPGEIQLQAFQEGLPPPPPVSHSWKRIDKWAEDNYQELWDQLCEGCTCNDLNELEHQLDCSLPMEVRESLQIHDGQERGGLPTGIIFGSMLLDCEEIVQEWENWKKVNQEYLTEHVNFKPAMPVKALGGSSSSTSKNSVHPAQNSLWRLDLLARQDSQPPEAIQKVYAHPSWIPMARDWGGNNLAVDLAPGPTGKWGQVILFGRDYDCKYVVARSWAAFLATVADDLNSGRWFVDEETNELKLREFKSTSVEPGYLDILRWRADQKYGRRGTRKKLPLQSINCLSVGSATSSPYTSPTTENGELRGRSTQRFNNASPVESPNRHSFAKSPLARVTEENSQSLKSHQKESKSEKLVELETPRPSEDEKSKKMTEVLLESVPLDEECASLQSVGVKIVEVEVNGESEKISALEDETMKTIAI